MKASATKPSFSGFQPEILENSAPCPTTIRPRSWFIRVVKAALESAIPDDVDTLVFLSKQPLSVVMTKERAMLTEVHLRWPEQQISSLSSPSLPKGNTRPERNPQKDGYLSCLKMAKEIPTYRLQVLTDFLRYRREQEKECNKEPLSTNRSLSARRIEPGSLWVPDVRPLFPELPDNRLRHGSLA